MFKKIKNKISTQQIRTISFLLAMSFYLASYILYPKGSYPGRTSRFLNLLGLLFISPALTYKIKEVPLKIHIWIENKTDWNPTTIYLLLIFLFLPVIFIGGYLSFKNSSQLDDFTQANWGLQLILVLIISLTFSFWERRQILQNKI